MTWPAPLPWTVAPGFSDAPVGAVMAFAGQLGAPVPATASPPTTPEAGANSTSTIEAWGWMLCDGRSLDTPLYPELFTALGYVYGGSGDSFNIPDYRGTFWRGADAGAGVDPDLNQRSAPGAGSAEGVGSKQPFALQTHQHHYNYVDTAATSDPGSAAGSPTATTQLTSGDLVGAGSPPITVEVSPNETRPRNVAVNYIIKFTSGLRPSGPW